MKEINNIQKLKKQVEKGSVTKHTYKELCEWIGWEVSTNHKAQLESIRHWMKVEKTPAGYVISEVYNNWTSDKKRGRPRKKEIDPNDYIFKRPVGRPRTRQPQLSRKELEERQGYSLYFRANSKYLEPSYHILAHEVLNNGGIFKCTLRQLLVCLGMPQHNESDIELQDVLNSNSELINFWYYVNGCCESILHLNIISGLCERKHIFDFNTIYCNVDTYSSDVNEFFASDEINTMIKDEINKILVKWEISKYHDLFYPNLENRKVAYEAKTEVNNLVYSITGWKYWGRGFEIKFTPQIPSDAVMYLKDYDIFADRKIINQLACQRITDTLSRRNQKCLNYDPNNKNQSPIIIGTGVDSTKEAHNIFNQNVSNIINKYLLIN